MRIANCVSSVLMLVSMLAGRGENRRPAIVGLKPDLIQGADGDSSSLSFGAGQNHGILFFGAGQWLAYIRVAGDRESVVTRFADGRIEESESWDSVRDLAISPDGGTLTYVGVRGDKSYFVSNDEPGPVYAGISESHRAVFSVDGNHRAYVASRDGQRSFAVHDGVEDPFEIYLGAKPFFTPINGKLIYLGWEPAPSDPSETKYFLVVDGKAGSRFSWTNDSIQIKPDTDEPVYVAGRDKAHFVVIGGREGKHYTDVSRPRISADGRTVAYVADLDRKTIVVVNDREFGPYECCTRGENLVMDPDGRRVTFPAGERPQSGNTTVYRLIADGVPSQQTYDRIENVVLSRPGLPRSRTAFTAGRGPWGDAHQAVVIDGVMGAEYEETHDLTFSSGGDLFYVAVENGMVFPVHEREPGPAFDDITNFTVSADGGSLAFLGVRHGTAYLVRWTGSIWKSSSPYDRILPPILFDASGEAVYRAARRGQQFVVIGDQEQAPYNAIHDLRLGLDGRGVLAVASAGKKMLLLLDGREIVEEEGIGDLGTPEKSRQPESRREIRVGAGLVNMFQARDGTFHLQVNDKTIYNFDNPTGGGPALVFHGELKNEDVLLLGEYHGDGCPTMNVLIAINSSGEPFVSDSFGDCHSEPSITAFEDRLEISFPGDAESKNAAQRWVYRPGGSFIADSPAPAEGAEPR